MYMSKLHEILRRTAYVNVMYFRFCGSTGDGGEAKSTVYNCLVVVVVVVVVVIFVLILNLN